MRRCEDEKMRYRPPLLEEPCAQTLSGIGVQHRKKVKVWAEGVLGPFLEDPGLGHKKGASTRKKVKV